MIPRYPLTDRVRRNTLFRQPHLDRTRWIRHLLNEMLNVVSIQFLNDLLAQHIITYGTYGIALCTQTRGMIDKVDRSTTGFLACWKHIP